MGNVIKPLISEAQPDIKIKVLLSKGLRNDKLTNFIKSDPIFGIAASEKTFKDEIVFYSVTLDQNSPINGLINRIRQLHEKEMITILYESVHNRSFASNAKMSLDEFKIKMKNFLFSIDLDDYNFRKIMKYINIIVDDLTINDPFRIILSIESDVMKTRQIVVLDNMFLYIVKTIDHQKSENNSN